MSTCWNCGRKNSSEPSSAWSIAKLQDGRNCLLPVLSLVPCTLSMLGYSWGQVYRRKNERHEVELAAYHKEDSQESTFPEEFWLSELTGLKLCLEYRWAPSLRQREARGPMSSERSTSAAIPLMPSNGNGINFPQNSLLSQR